MNTFGEEANLTFKKLNYLNNLSKWLKLQIKCN